MARNFGKYKDIGIPPESTGPRIHNLLSQSANLVSIAGGTIVPGLAISGDVSNATGTVRSVNGSSILVVFNGSSPVQSFQAENVTIQGGITATVTGTTNVYTNATAIVGGENPHNAQRVDRQGAAYVRFVEGPQQIDAFGITKTSSQTILDAHKFDYFAQNPEVSDVIVGAATLTHLADEATASLNVTSANGDSITRTADLAHRYVPGVGRNGLFSIACGDAGKANNTRRWGLFNVNDGVFFELNGTTFNVVVRSSTSGSPVNTSVAQANWNRDVLNGSADETNRSGVLLDLTNVNTYWIDYGWLGAGQVRFGIYAPNGDRTICHQFENANANAVVYMKTGTLPVRWENTNTAATSGISSMKTACALVANDSAQQTVVHPSIFAYDRTGVSVATGSETPLLNLRSALTFNSITNRVRSTGVTATVYTATDATVIRVYANATIGGSPSWGSITSTSPLEVDTAGTVSGGTKVATIIIGSADAATIPLNFLELHTNAAATSSKTYSLTAQSIGAGASNTSIAFSWIDLG